MSAFHRPPEWQQQADRHTQLVDPVLTVRQLSRFDFNLRSLVRIDHALVFSTPKGGYDPYLPPRRPTRGEIAAKRYTAVYEVDMGVHPFSAELTLPSDNDAFEFTAAVDISWQVLDPARFVASGHRDVPGLLLGELQQAARPVTRRFAIADSAAAERELQEAVTVLGPLGAPAGLQVTWTLRLRRDQDNIDHQRRLQAIDHSAAEQIRAAQQGTQVDVEMDRRYRRQDALQIERAMAYGTQAQDLALQQQRWQHEQVMLHSGQQHELALQQGQQMLELQRVEAQKIEFYQWHLQQGGVHAWALHLAQHPEDSRLVMTSMREDQLRMIQAQMDLVKQLLSSDTAENYELEGPKQLALRTVSDILNQRLPGVPQTPPLIPSPGDGTGYDGTQPSAGAAYGTPPGPGPSDQPPAQLVTGVQPPTAAPAQESGPTTAAPAPAQSSAPANLGAQSAAAGSYGAHGGPYGTASAPHGGDPSGPYGPAGAAQQAPATPPCAPPPTAPGAPPAAPPAWQPPTAYAPAPPPFPGQYPGVPTPRPAAPTAPAQPPAWQPPPGYGSTPTLPGPPTSAERDDGASPAGPVRQNEPEQGDRQVNAREGTGT
jgi:hypothetical protein